MSVQAALRAVIAAPLSTGARLAFADAVAATDPDRARLVEVQVARLTAVREGRDDPRIAGWAQEEMDLLRGADRWWPSVDGVEFEEVQRGFAEGVFLAARRFVDLGEELFGCAPILHAFLDEVRPTAAAAFASPLLARLHSLDLRTNGLGDSEVELLAQSPQAQHLVWLDLSGNPIGERALEAVAASPHLAGLQWLGFSGTAIPDPTPQVSEDQGTVVHVTHSGRRTEIEARFGPKAWLRNPRFEHPHPPPAWFYPLTD